MRTTTPCTRYRTAARICLIVLALAATGSLAYRIVRASDFGWHEAAGSAGTALLVVGTLTAGWMLNTHKLRARVNAAEWEAAVARRDQTLLDGEEDRALWDSVPAAVHDEETCAFGPGVVAINQYRRQQGQRAG